MSYWRLPLSAPPTPTCKVRRCPAICLLRLRRATNPVPRQNQCENRLLMGDRSLRNSIVLLCWGYVLIVCYSSPCGAGYRYCTEHAAARVSVLAQAVSKGCVTPFASFSSFTSVQKTKLFAHTPNRTLTWRHTVSPRLKSSPFLR